MADTPARNGRREQRPSFQFYPQDFLSSPKVRRMTAAARGAYITLLCDEWLEGSLPADMQDLADRAGMGIEEFEVAWAGPLGRCFEARPDGRLVNERMERERGVAEERSRRLAESGAKGGRKRREDHPSEGLAALSGGEATLSQAQAPLQPGLASAKPSGMGWDGMGRDSGEETEEGGEPTGFPWPEWVDESRRDQWVQRVNDGALALIECRSSPAWLDGIRQALAQLTAPLPGEGELERALRSQFDPAAAVLEWARLIEGRGIGYATAALRQGPKAALWQHPRLAADHEANKRAASRRKGAARA